MQSEKKDNNSPSPPPSPLPSSSQVGNSQNMVHNIYTH